MARKAKEEKKYLEFKVKGTVFTFSGRLYPENQKETEKCTITPFSLTLNEFITIKGMKLFQTDNNSWIQGPQYKSGEEYKDYLYIDPDFSKDEISKLVSELEKLLDA